MGMGQKTAWRPPPRSLALPMAWAAAAPHTAMLQTCGPAQALRTGRPRRRAQSAGIHEQRAHRSHERTANGRQMAAAAAVVRRRPAPSLPRHCARLLEEDAEQQRRNGLPIGQRNRDGSVPRRFIAQRLGVKALRPRGGANRAGGRGQGGQQQQGGPQPAHPDGSARGGSGEAPQPPRSSS